MKFLYFLTFFCLTACSIEASSESEGGKEESVYTGDLLFYDDALDLDQYLDESERKPFFPIDLDQEELKPNPQKVQEVYWGEFPRVPLEKPSSEELPES